MPFSRRSAFRGLFAAVGLAVLWLLGVVAWRAGPGAARFAGTVPEVAAPAADFALREHTGRPVTLADYRGHPVFLFFGYTRCPNVCPLTLDRLARAIADGGSGAQEARILLVTVDPEHDTPEVLAAYAARFGPPVRGLTGSPAALARARAAYGIHATTGPAAAHADHGRGGAMLGHTPVVFGIDRAGRLRVVFGDEATDAEVRSNVRALARG